MTKIPEHNFILDAMDPNFSLTNPPNKKQHLKWLHDKISPNGGDARMIISQSLESIDNSMLAQVKKILSTCTEEELMEAAGNDEMLGVILDTSEIISAMMATYISLEVWLSKCETEMRDQAFARKAKAEAEGNVH